MDRLQAKNLVVNTFENPFSKDNFVAFLRNLLKSFEVKRFVYRGNYISDPFKPYISSLERIGQYHCDNREIDLLVVYLKRRVSLERARTMQRNFIAWYLKGSRGGKLRDAALVAFVSPDSENWRFSLVKMDYHFEETPSGRIKVKEEFTPARRWSFLVGKNERSHTAQSRFVPILEEDGWKPTLEDLERAFDVEVVTKEFFEKYRDLFIRTKLELDKIVNSDLNIKREFQSKNIDTVNFAKKLLGQIVFLYFLQKKGWFGVEKEKSWGTGPKDFMRRLFNKEFGDYDNFYNDILEPLFYEALRTNRSADDHYYSRFNCKIPFLNGGLFDPINGFDWVNTDILLPNELFSNTNRTKEGDIGDGILDVFGRYNFTVNEDEPLEKEVALDPELLGKIYEKLNAIRPDNFEEYIKVLKSGKKGEETKFNKEYGVYYTPREIVHYMCRESLLNYLETELNGKVSKEDLEKFFNYAETHREFEEIAIEKEEKIKSGSQESTSYESQIPESIRRNAKEIDDLLADIKVCDPAVGSGAFPISMMHEIVKLRSFLSIYLSRKINSYELKRHCIENSLYGGDIDPGAVEICKLRFWLSMIVDEEDFYNVKPLPNLDYKVVCGDSLLSYPYTPQGLERVERLKTKYFNEPDPLKKQELKKQIDSAIYGLLKNTPETLGYKVTMDFKIHFSEVFHQKNGFDVVIENPPYVRQERIKDYKPLLKKVNYEVFTGTSDLYTYFYEKSYEIAKPKGFICMIVSNKWMRAKYGEKLRKFLKEKAVIKQIIDFNGYSIFEATVDTNIILFQKDKPQNNQFYALTVGQDFDVSKIYDYVKSKSILMEQNKLEERAFVLAEDKILKLKEKIEKIGKPLKDWDVKIYFGIKTGFNKAFIIDTETKNRILANCKTEEERKRTEEIIKPVLRGRDIGRYCYEWKDLWMIVIPAGWTNQNRGEKSAEDYFKEAFPSIYNHFISFSRYKGKGKGLFNRDDKGDYWWELRHCDYYPEFEKEKVVWQHVSGRYPFSYVSAGLYLTNALFMITHNNNNISELKLVLAVLNSKVGDNLFQSFTNLSSIGKYAYGAKDKIELIPIPSITSQNQHLVGQIENLVDKILQIKKRKGCSANTSELESRIDQLVYKLYGLAEEEIKIVEEGL